MILTVFSVGIDIVQFLQYYPLRIRVMSLLVEALGFPACGDAATRQEQAERFVTFDTLIDNLYVSITPLSAATPSLPLRICIAETELTDSFLGLDEIG